MAMIKKRGSEDSQLTEMSDNVPLSKVKERIRTLGIVETRRYLELAEGTQPSNLHESHELDLIKGLLEARLSKLITETMLAGFDEQASDRALSFQESIVTLRTKKRCSLGGLSDGSLNLHELEQLLTREDVEQVANRQLTTEQCQTIQQLQKEMSYGQLYNNIEELLLTEEEAHSYEDDSSVESDTDSFIEEEFYNRRKSVRSKVYHNLTSYTRRIVWKLGHYCRARPLHS